MTKAAAQKPAEASDEVAGDASADALPRSFSFGTESYRPMSALPALDRMSERLAKRIRDAIEPIARVKPHVEAESVAIRRFETWCAERPDFTALATYRMRPLKGGVLIASDPMLVRQLVDTFYGGSGAASATSRTEFTGTEDRLRGRLDEAVMACVIETWGEVMSVAGELTARETNMAYAGLVRRDEPVAVARFQISIGTAPPTPIDIVYPVAALRAVEAELAAKVHDDGAAGSAEWRTRVAAALGEVRVEARSVLARPVMQLADLVRLAPGDVIPVSLPAMVPLLVAGRQIALGTIGDQDGRAALKIEKMAERSLPND